jgi:hypothetical protein
MVPQGLQVWVDRHPKGSLGAAADTIIFILLAGRPDAPFVPRGEHLLAHALMDPSGA